MNAQLLDEIFAMIIEKIVYSQTLKTKRHDDSDGSEDHFKDPSNVLEKTPRATQHIYSFQYRGQAIPWNTNRASIQFL